MNLLDINTVFPAEIFDDGPLETISLWEREVSDGVFSDMLEAEVYEYQDRLFVSITYHDIAHELIYHDIARFGMFDSMEDLREALSMMWPDNVVFL